MTASNRQSFLTLDPIKFSLTEGTNIPPPEDTPPSTSNGTQTTNVAEPTNAVKDTDDTQDAPQPQPDRATGTPSVLSSSTSPQRHGVRRLFSLGSLRSSFSSSRASLNLPQDSAQQRESTDTAVKQPSSPSASHRTAASTRSQKSRGTLRKSDSWFKRKSGMVWSNGDKPLASIGEDGRPESKRAREHSPAPLLPDIKSLAGGDLKDGQVEWDAQQFKRPT